MKLSESTENYLETILILKQRNGFVHAIDIANEFNYSRPSVSKATSNLKKDGYITVDSDNHIELTIEGYKTAIKVYERHDFLRTFLMQLGVSELTAEKDACKMEHAISDESLEAMRSKCKHCSTQKNLL